MSVPDPIIEQPAAALVLRPVAAATITPGDGPVFIGLGDLDLTCPEACPKVRLPPARYRYLKAAANTPDPWNPNDTNFPMTPLCSVCRDSGQCVPVSGPHLIVVDGVILWYAHMEYLPVGRCVDDEPHVCWMMSGKLVAHYPRNHYPDEQTIDITGAPGSWEPGKWAAHVTWIGDTIPCPIRHGMKVYDCPLGCDDNDLLHLPLVLSSAADRPCITTLDLTNLGVS